MMGGGLIETAGYAALLIWGIHMITSGVLRGFGATLRQLLARAVASPFKAFTTGLGVTLILQSSTATGLMAASFTAEGLVVLQSGYLMMLGANVGTSLVARVLSFPIGAIAPLALLMGVVLFRRSRTDKVRNLGRIAIGLGLMLLALHALVNFLEPLSANPAARAVEEWVFQKPWLTVGLAATLAWLCHSSMAIVLLAAALGQAQGLSAEVAIALMLGANVGAAIPPVLAVNTVAARRLPVGNLLIRALGCFFALLTSFIWVPSIPSSWALDPAFVANAHVVFNLLLALIAAPFAGPVSKLLNYWMPDPPEPDDIGLPRHLDMEIVRQPHLALVQAERETLRLADRAERMLNDALLALKEGDGIRIDRLDREEYGLSRLGMAIRRYLAEIAHENMSPDEIFRQQEIQRFVFDLEGFIDIAAHHLLAPSLRQRKTRIAFSPEEWSEVEASATEVRTAFRLAFAVFVAQDVQAARSLVNRKHTLRVREHEVLSARQKALRSEDPVVVRSGDEFLKVMRELKRAYSQLTGVAYNTLEQHGHLQPRIPPIA